MSTQEKHLNYIRRLGDALIKRGIKITDLTDPEEVINLALSAEKESLVSRIEKLKRFETVQAPCPDGKPGCAVYHTQQIEDTKFNSALDQVISILKEEENDWI